WCPITANLNRGPNIMCMLKLINHLLSRKDVAKTPADVAVTSGDSSLHVRTPRGELCLTLPAGVTYEQGSCIPTPAGECCGEELHFRLRISVERSTDEGNAQDDLPLSSCAPLCQDEVFKRVLPLPNGNWNAIVDDWCCHPDPFANKKLLPRAEDCLLGDSFVLLARDGSCEQTLTEEASPVGTEDSQDSKLAPICFTVSRTVAARLLELANSLNTFHFSVQTPDGKAFLLVRTTQVLCYLRNGKRLEYLKGYKSLIDCDYRVGFFQISYNVVTSWEVNATGHPVELPLKVCEELLQVMDDSNSTLPASMHCMRSYEVRRLPCIVKPCS
uniref:E3 ubiquitin-protein ligase E3D n=1 Tax=Amphilophus citrinellus TaxID=61819 RepID=A0A3Q0QU12_AMPCI